ncbi:CRISPR-associated endonuclease Cas2 [Pectinatus cerevisiiphilus]|uniref:CRISPR-associated endoribonuclease Cas2 n=1 Tax=Pectinatus cerevisiiphilus TaxID=86956 RepID=A0A4V2URC8_9FIRM|nr:CRISPR-associated endonuclease Cas2 [Pectinatus cerevisiiphilus]TCS77232.1 CRISPR-associated Cas2 family protein [Pectinatus cerevisiiphilus]
MYLVLVYDIKLDVQGAKVLRNVFKICKKYLTHIQNSVFEGELSDGQLLKLKIEIQKYLRQDIDSCIIFKGRNNIWMQKEFITDEDDKTSQFL